MEYVLHQRGRASIDFLVDLRRQSDRLEQTSDQYAERHGLTNQGLTDQDTDRDIEELHLRITPKMLEYRDFRILRLMRDWQMDHHGLIAMEAFDEMRGDVEPTLRALLDGPTKIAYSDDKKAPDYWDGYEFHRSAGGWDGHDYMGFIHSELIHRKMVGETFAGAIYQQRKSVAEMAALEDPGRILEMGCSSGQFTAALAETFPDSEIWACDLSPRQLEQAQRRANERGMHWHLLQAPAEKTGLDDQMFDLVASYAIFHELPFNVIKAVLKETYRLLKPGGSTLVGDIKSYRVLDSFSKWKADFWNQKHGGDPFWREFATTNLAELATEVGFSEARWAGFDETQYPFVLTAVKPVDK